MQVRITLSFQGTVEADLAEKLHAACSDLAVNCGVSLEWLRSSMEPTKEDTRRIHIGYKDIAERLLTAIRQRENEIANTVLAVMFDQCHCTYCGRKMAYSGYRTHKIGCHARWVWNYRCSGCQQAVAGEVKYCRFCGESTTFQAWSQSQQGFYVDLRKAWYGRVFCDTCLLKEKPKIGDVAPAILKAQQTDPELHRLRQLRQRLNRERSGPR